jgi:hypothetical protein
MIIATIIVLLDEATLGSKPRRSFNASKGGNSKAKGYGTNARNARNLKPNNALYLKFEGSFGGLIMHKINHQNLNKIIFTQTKTK